MPDAFTRPSEPVRLELVAAVDLLDHQRAYRPPVLRHLLNARRGAERARDQALVGQLDLALSDLAHCAERLQRVQHRVAELAGVDVGEVERG